MSGIQIHTQDPISPANASGVTPQTAHNPECTSQPPTTTTTASRSYPPARPGVAAPTPTGTLASSSAHGPAPPQPEAIPGPALPATIAKAGLPPPPKAGEKPMPPEHYAPVHSTPTQPQPYPPQMVPSPLIAVTSGMAPGSTTSTTTQNSFDPSAPATSLPSSAEPPARVSLEHPPGYVQNPYASDMTPAQQRAAAQEENWTETVRSLGYNDNAKAGRNAELGEDESVWDMATKWAKKTGEQASELHGQVWEKIYELSRGK